MKLKLHVDDYLTAIAAVSLLRLQAWAVRNLPQWQGLLDKERPIQPRDDHVEVDSGVLEHLPEWYFQYMLEQHSVAARERDKFRNITDFQYVKPKEQITRLRDSINFNVRKLENYFSGHPRLTELHQLLAEVKELKPESAESELPRLRDRYIDLLTTPEFDERLTLNIIRSFMSNNFFGQTSMLQKTLSQYTAQQHIDKMREDFVKPVLFDIALREWIDNHPNPDKQSQQQLVELLKQSKRYPSREWEQPIKKMAPEEIHAFLNGKLRCSFEDEWFATMHFEEMVFGPLGISGALFNFNWDLEQHPMPISSWIRLVLFLAPVGLTRFTRYYRDEFETYYSFVYRDGTPQTIYEDNNELENLERNESFERLIPKLVQRQAFKARREHQPNIQVIEFYSDLGMRKTVMNYYHIPRHMIVYFSSNLNRLQYLHRPIRDPFLHLVMESVDPIPEIWRYMHKVILGQGQAYSAWLAVRERWVIQELKKKEGAKMTAEELRKKAGLIYHISQEGVKIRKGLERRADRQAESTDYVSSGGKRAAGIAHRLLNAAKARDKHQFLDTTIRLYLSVGEPVPNSLLNVLHEERVDFNTWAGAFIAGLLGADPSEKSDETATDEHAVNE